MVKFYLNPLLFIFLFGFSCSDSPEPSPSGICRVSKIIYLSANERFEQIFEYNSEDLLTGYNLPFIGSTCKEILEYDDQKRLLTRTLVCDNKTSFEIEYQYITPYTLEGKYKNYLKGEAATVLFYYNTNNQIDSIRSVDPDFVNFSTFSYLNNNLISNVEIKNPCCWTYSLSEATYDNGLNPFNLLKKSSNNLGMESISNFLPSGTLISSTNNPLEFKRVWESRASVDDPRITEQRINNHKFFYEYYENSPYPKRRRSSFNGVED